MTTEDTTPRIDRRILGLPVPTFLILTTLVVILAALSPADTGMTTAFALTMTTGGALMWIGSAIPYFNFIGGGVILCILGPSILNYLDLVPSHLITTIESFYEVSGFGQFVVAALITGSILGMPRTLLIKAGTRIIVPIIAVIIGCIAILGTIGELAGMGAGYTIFYVVGPVLGGGVAAGAIPISEIIAGQSGGNSTEYLTLLVPAVAVANIVCIISAGGMNFAGKKLGTRWKGFNGHGVLARDVSTDLSGRTYSMTNPVIAIKSAVTGFLLAGMLFIIANFVATLIPQLHAYVFLILICAVLKVFVQLPTEIEEAVDLWYVFVANSMIPAVLATLSIVSINIDDLLALLSDPGYMVMTVATVLLAIAIAGAIGWLMRLYIIESAISAGLGLADFGSSGDLAVLQASQRLDLLPFLSISSRIGGGIVLLTMSLLAPLLL
ncbi:MULTISPECIES: 2-hydroxycarboxylate transporter family protein [Auritidibacter]|uniref:2-hydroxycarboxylate transporter family protein n=1 Tax=Auritidibacter TaxID=1160973 RepID=UPI000D731D47|nr:MULTISPECIES: 2-hydroxycarboxylate transporter family protein [Auritidibacter]PXA79217.1 2-hydroxycarboxylate transporter [Auritidibacter sp. NML120636]WGH90403.1 2-hydroxycarboxylate transporter family protein [Auritidibacter ignavus]